MVMAKAMEFSFDTLLDTRRLALTFREGLQNPSGGWVGMLAAHGLEWDFFTPEVSDDPFAALEDRQDPTFTAGASYGIRGLGERMRITTFERYLQAKSGGAVLLQVWENGDHRQVVIRHVGDLSPASQKCVRTVLDAYRAADPAIKVRQDKGRVRI